MVTAIQELTEAVQEQTELTEGGFVDSFTSHREICGTLSDILQMEAARLRLQFREARADEAAMILDVQKKRKAKWAEDDKAREAEKKQREAKK